MPSASQLYGGTFLRAVDLTPLGKRRIAHIHEASPETIGQDQKLTLSLVAENGRPWPKKIVLNKGNTMQLVTAFGDDYMLWPGKAIEVWSENVMFQGRMQPGIKILPAPRQPAQAAAPIAPDEDEEIPGDDRIDDDRIPF